MATLTKNDLVKLIAEIARREIKKEINRIFINEDKSIELKKVVPTKSLKKSDKVTKPKKKKEVFYTGNQVLNEVLNKTEGGVPQGDGTEPYPTLGGGTFTSDRMAELVGYGNEVGGNDERKREVAAVSTIKDMGKSVDDVSEEVVDALTRDYSGLMKVINKKDNVKGNNA
tara:strand:+ start:1803 stop:2312 length:510 start_codon:yes stop_codon:yes gene_type:complete